MKIFNDTGNFDLFFFGLRFVVLLFEKSTYKRFAFHGIACNEHVYSVCFL